MLQQLFPSSSSIYAGCVRKCRVFLLRVALSISSNSLVAMPRNWRLSLIPLRKSSSLVIRSSPKVSRRYSPRPPRLFGQCAALSLGGLRLCSAAAAASRARSRCRLCRWSCAGSYEDRRDAAAGSGAVGDLGAPADTSSAECGDGGDDDGRVLSSAMVSLCALLRRMFLLLLSSFLPSLYFLLGLLFRSLAIGCAPCNGGAIIKASKASSVPGGSEASGAGSEESTELMERDILIPASASKRFRRERLR